MIKFEANRAGFFNVLLLAAILLPVVIYVMDRSVILERPFILLPLLVPAALLIWFYVGTEYIIQEHKLLYKSAFIKGEIDIQKIREISKGKTMWIGLRPATATNGLVIRFNTYDEIYVSPKDHSAFIDALKQINGNIKVV